MEPPSSVSFCPCLAADTVCRRSCEDAAAQHLQLYFLPREERGYTHTDTGYFCRVGVKPSKLTPRMLLGQSRHNIGKTRVGFDHGVRADPLISHWCTYLGLLDLHRAPAPPRWYPQQWQSSEPEVLRWGLKLAQPWRPVHPISLLLPGGPGQTSALHTQT